MLDAKDKQRQQKSQDGKKSPKKSPAHVPLKQDLSVCALIKDDK
jgi:hypothetical protein